MFFSTYVLTKKGPLAKVWLAAHWDRRLTRNEVKVVDLSQTIMHIVRPVVPIALRTSGELLVGVVRIYVLKVKHLLREATEATLFLRVTTMTAKGSASAATQHTAGASGSNAATAEEKSAMMDGVLVRGKGDVEAVTFDWSAEVAAKHGSMPEAAEALSGARFDAIADLLGAQQVSGAHQEDGLLAQAWYTVEPSSQIAEELHNTQQDYDEIAKMRADLMAFGDRASSSGSRSKSSLSSIEKGRGSAAVGGVIGDDVPFPAVADELDIGVPVPDDLASNVPLLGTQGGVLSGAVGLPEDPFAIPDVLGSGPAQPERKARPVNVLDLAATTLPREVFERCMSDRSDIVNAEPRRGPLDEQEEADRYTIACLARPTDAGGAASLSLSPLPAAAGSAGPDAGPILSAADATLLSAQPNPSLRAAFASVLQQQVAAAVEEAARLSQSPPAGGRRSDAAVAAMPEEQEEDGAMGERVREAEELRASRKRARSDAENDDPRSLSSNAVQTLQRIRAEALRVSRRKLKPETVPQGLVGATCSLKGVCHGLRRREAARTFVDVLTLASKQLVDVHQEDSGGDVEVRLQQASASVPVS